jgi:hypothetical protein
MKQPSVVNLNSAMQRVFQIPLWINTLFARNQNRLLKVALLIPVFITGLYTRAYTGEYEQLVNNHLGGVFYVLFGSLAISVLFPHIRAYKPPLIAFGLTCLLEFVQGFRFPFMIELTKIKAFAYLFGNSYNSLDFIFYVFGATAGFLVLLLVSEKKTVKSEIVKN